MKLNSIPAPVYYIAAAAATVGFLYYLFKSNGGAKGAGQSAGEAIGGAIGAAATGTVLGIGDGLGIPRTDQTECEKAKAEGRSWDASFACKASDFLDYVVNGYKPKTTCIDCAGKTDTSQPYDYGVGGDTGIPWRIPKSTPDPIPTIPVFKW